MQTLVNAIRATGATNIIGLSGVQWANTLTQWRTYKPTDPLNNLAATWNAYNFNWWTTPAQWDTVTGPTAAQYPLIVTETGNSTCNATWINSLLNWLDARGAGYVPWVWEAWGTSCSGLALITDFAGTPTVSGQVYKTHFLTRP
jgi:hypothetical protein